MTTTSQAIDWLERACEAALVRQGRQLNRMRDAVELLNTRGTVWDQANVARCHQLCEAADANVKAAQSALSWALKGITSEGVVIE